MTWETMSITQKVTEEQPFIFLVPGPEARIEWNAATQNLLHNAGHVELVVDRERQMLGVKPCPGNAPQSVVAQRLNPRRPVHGLRPSPRWGLALDPAGVAAAFEQAGIAWPDDQQAYIRDAKLDGDVVYIPLNELRTAGSDGGS